jgi:hypothetical protein
LQKVLFVSKDLLSFNPIKVGTTSNSYVALVSAGNTVVTLSGISVSGQNASDFTLSGCTSGITQQVVLAGSGYVAGAPVIPGIATFSATAVGSPAATNSLNFTNSSSSAVPISAPALVGADAGDFAITGTTCAGTLAAQSACSVTVSFTPSSAGSRYRAVEMAFGGSGGFPRTLLLGEMALAGQATWPLVLPA